MISDHLPEWICVVLALCLIGGLVLLYSKAVIAFRDRLPQPVSKLLPMPMLALINLSPYYH
jgi:hypothetical protein